MNLQTLKGLFPHAHKQIHPLLNSKTITEESLDGLSHYSLEMMEAGETPPRDIRVLLMARTDKKRREQRGPGEKS